jgi:hypothetical protein
MVITSALSVQRTQIRLWLRDLKFPQTWCSGFCEVSGFRRSACEVLALLGCYSAYVGSCLPTFRHNLMVSFSKVKPGILHCVVGYLSHSDVSEKRSASMFKGSSLLDENQLKKVNSYVLSKRLAILNKPLDREHPRKPDSSPYLTVP